MDIDEFLGIDRNDPDQARASRQVENDWDMLHQLVAIRKASPLTQMQVAKAMGVSQSVVARIESGVQDPHMSTLRRYAVAIGAEVRHSVVAPESDTPKETSWSEIVLHKVLEKHLAERTMPLLSFSRRDPSQPCTDLYSDVLAVVLSRG